MRTGVWLLVAGMIGASSVISGAVVRTSSVYPTGTTIYHPEKTWNGFTVFITPENEGVVVIDMNGHEVKKWPGLAGAAGGPARILPGGFLIASSGDGAPHQEANALVQLDFEGKEMWRFDRTEQVKRPDGQTQWSARQHHDWQRPTFPAGYFAPGVQPAVSGGPTLVLTHTNLVNPQISDRRLEDDRLLEIAWDGKVLWEWKTSDHVDELGFSADARDAIRQAPGFNKARDSFDWLHINAAAYVGPNHWFDEGDQRFAPENILISSREASFIAIVNRTGKIVWRMGPDYRDSEALRKLGQIIGQHNPHIIPKGLPGAGNLLVFDNGGASGYGAANPAAPEGVGSFRRGNSRVLEVNPVTFEKKWEYSVAGTESYRFFSHYVSNAQRLVNGNTMITEGADGRIFEVTTGGEIVWEYVSPYFTQNGNTNRVYRAYRVPYDWIPQLPRPTERAVIPPNVRDFHLTTSVSAQAPTTLTADDTSAIQAMVRGYAQALSACRAEEYADLFAPDVGYFASGIRGQVVGHERLIALVQSERQCTAPAGTAPSPRPGGGNGPTVALEVTSTGVRGIADLGAAGQYQDEYVKTPKGWRFRSRTVLTPAERAAGLDANEMLAIQHIAGTELGDYYVPDQNGVKRLRTSGVAISVSAGAITGHAYLKNGGYYDDVYEKVAPGQWRIKSRTLVPSAP